MRQGKWRNIPLWFLVSLTLIYSANLFSLPPDTLPKTNHANIKPHGTFTLVDSRRASYIAAPIISMLDLHNKEPKTINFGKVLKWHDGTVCSKWELKPNHIYCAFLEDPLLTDTQIKSNRNGSPVYLINQGYEVLCEGIGIGSLTDIDGRVLIVPMNNSAVNGIFEKSITQDTMHEMLRVLGKINYISKTPDRITQDEFRETVSSYVSDMRGFNIKFYRSPITMGVLDELIENIKVRKKLGLQVTN